MKTKDIINTVTFGEFTMNITKSNDSFNGLIYKDSELIGCVAAGLSEGVERLIDKAEIKTGFSK